MKCSMYFCLTVCVPDWNEIQSRSSGGATLNSASTLADCQAACVADTTCVAVDWVIASNQCWMHNNAANLNDMRNTAGVTQYQLVDRCPGIASYA